MPKGLLTLVFGVMFVIFNQSFVFSLIVASMSAATPAGTLMVIQQYRAKGPLTNFARTDDAGIMVFGFALSISKLVLDGSTASVMMFLSN